MFHVISLTPLYPGGLVVVALILLLTVYSLRRLWVVWAEILNFDGVSGDTRDTWLVTRGGW